MTRRTRSPRPRQILRAAALVGVFALLASCASMPESGPVGEVSDVHLRDGQEPHVRVFALPPRDNQDPVGIVNGFLEAVTSDEPGFDTARRYLTGKARAAWHPEAGTIVFGRKATLPLVQETRDRVVLRPDEVAQVDSTGFYRPSVPGQRVDAGFQLAQVRGQWRINALPDGVYVSELDFSRLYRPVNLYYFDPARRRLVPEPIHVASRAGQLSAVVRGLLRGPEGPARSAVYSAFPPDTQLVGNEVPIEDGIPQVRLSGAALTAGPRERELMSAQLVWTLAQLGFREVRVSVEGGELGVRGTQRYAEYDPTVPKPVTGYFHQSGKLIKLLGQPPAPVPGPFGTGRLATRARAVSPANEAVAGVSLDGRALYVGTMTNGSTAVSRLRGESLSAPSWDGQSRLWVADTTGDGSRLWVLPGGSGAPEKVAAPELAGTRIRGLRLSEDGTRVAVLVQDGARTRLRVARVVAHGADRSRLALQGLRPVVDGLGDIRDVVWSEAAGLTLLAVGEAGVPLPFQVAVDGSDLTSASTGPGLPLVSIAAAAEAPLLAATQEGSIWRQSPNGRWTRIGSGRDPIYPG